TALLGGGIAGGSPFIHSTVVANNIGGVFPDLFGSATATFSLIGHIDASLSTLRSGSANNLLNRDPLLGPLADNGGPTWTHALFRGSPAINAGSNPANLIYDQRGTGFLREIGKRADIGAYELQFDLAFSKLVAEPSSGTDFPLSLMHGGRID